MSTLAIAIDGYLPQRTPLTVFSQGYLFLDAAVLHYVEVPYRVQVTLDGRFDNEFAAAMLSPEAREDAEGCFADEEVDALYVPETHLEAQL